MLDHVVLRQPPSNLVSTSTSILFLFVSAVSEHQLFFPSSQHQQHINMIISLSPRGARMCLDFRSFPIQILVDVLPVYL